ncbi:MAG: DUF2948 family protein [Holosporales bacterium]|jgi:hypothetical protein|nr:DUF2948 family protein [Holosporales bacterium]
MKAKAVCSEEMSTASALLQDSLLNLTFVKHKDKKLHMLVNRFCWEITSAAESKKKAEAYFRSHCGVYVSNVIKLKTNRKVDLVHYSAVLSLLAINFDRDIMKFVFSGGLELSAHCNDPTLYLMDMHEPWPTNTKPKHKL